MLTLMTPCEPPIRSIWHLVSGVAVLAVLWAITVVAWQWLAR
ncbi:MAG: hypothetical protein JWM57_1341 [Phycisphaerales bacterium]|nr:hypothetical protein [Phycisphaerales bacterium]